MALKIKVRFWIKIEEISTDAATDQDRAMHDNVSIK